MAEHVHDDERAHRRAGRAVAADAVDDVRGLAQVGVELGGVDAERDGLRVDEVRHRVRVRHRVGGGDEGQRRHQHLVAGLHAGEQQADVQRRGAVRRRDGVRGAGDGGEVALEAIDERADRRDPAGVEALLDVLPFAAGELGLVQRDRAGRGADDAAHRGEDGVDDGRALQQGGRGGHGGFHRLYWPDL